MRLFVRECIAAPYMKVVLSKIYALIIVTSSIATQYIVDKNIPRTILHTRCRSFPLGIVVGAEVVLGPIQFLDKVLQTYRCQLNIGCRAVRL